MNIIKKALNTMIQTDNDRDSFYHFVGDTKKEMSSAEHQATGYLNINQDHEITSHFLLPENSDIRDKCEQVCGSSKVGNGECVLAHPARTKRVQIKCTPPPPAKKLIKPSTTYICDRKRCKMIEHSYKDTKFANALIEFQKAEMDKIEAEFNHKIDRFTKEVEWYKGASTNIAQIVKKFKNNKKKKINDSNIRNTFVKLLKVITPSNWWEQNPIQESLNNNDLYILAQAMIENCRKDKINPKLIALYDAINLRNARITKKYKELKLKLITKNKQEKRKIRNLHSISEEQELKLISDKDIDTKIKLNKLAKKELLERNKGEITVQGQELNIETIVIDLVNEHEEDIEDFFVKRVKKLEILKIRRNQKMQQLTHKTETFKQDLMKERNEFLKRAGIKKSSSDTVFLIEVNKLYNDMHKELEARKEELEYSSSYNKGILRQHSTEFNKENLAAGILLGVGSVVVASGAVNSLISATTNKTTSTLTTTSSAYNAVPDSTVINTSYDSMSDAIATNFNSLKNTAYSMLYELSDTVYVAVKDMPPEVLYGGIGILVTGAVMYATYKAIYNNKNDIEEEINGIVE